MPYIPKEKRKKYDESISRIVDHLSMEDENDVGGLPKLCHI